jgi:hypothetical protein
MRFFHAWLGNLWLLGAAIGQGCIDEGPEPNDFAGVPTVAGCGMRATGFLAPGDADYYAVAVGAPTLLRAYTSYGKASVAAVDTIVAIHDAADVLLASDDDAGLGLWSYAGCNIVAPGVYYVVVTGFAAATTGAYTLDILCNAPVLPETAEPNDDPLLGGTPCPAGCGLQHAGEIAIAGDTDWWAFVHGGGPLTITTGPSGPGGVPAGLALVDTTIELFDALSIAVPLSFNDDGGEALYSSTSLGMVPAGFYFVEVAGFGAGTGHYSLRIGCGEPASAIADVLIPAAAPPGCIGALTFRAAAPLGARVRPRLGTTYSLDVSGLPPFAPAVNVIGLSLLAPAFPLAAFGAPGCFLSVALDVMSLAPVDAFGESEICFFIPATAGLSGRAVHFQTVCGLPLGTTNVVTGIIGNLGFP